MSAYACSIVALKDEDGTPLLPSRIPIGGVVHLKRERGRAGRPETIAAYHDRRKVGYLPPEKRWIWEALNDNKHTVIVVGQIATTSGELIAFDVEITLTERRLPRLRHRTAPGPRRLLRLMPAFAALALTFATLVALERIDARRGPATSEATAPQREGRNTPDPSIPSGKFEPVASISLVAALEARRAERDGHGEPEMIPGGLQAESAFQDMREQRRAIDRVVNAAPAVTSPAAKSVVVPPRAVPLPRRPQSNRADLAVVSTRPAIRPADAMPIRPAFPAVAFALSPSTRAEATAGSVTMAESTPPEAIPHRVDDAAPPIAASTSQSAWSDITVTPRMKPMRKLAKPVIAQSKPVAKKKKKRTPPPAPPGPRSPGGNAAESPDW
ncbi:MAG TPA: hypothetical protein VJS40_00515 [Aestuariivirgaceae bacterium]|nr:hypothetical protein [Aestuariivirgaceae bacterium]